MGRAMTGPLGAERQRVRHRPLFRKLWIGDERALKAHFHGLGGDNLQQRFGRPMSPGALSQYCDSVDWWRGVKIGAFDGGSMVGLGELQAVGHLFPCSSEIAVSVWPQWQDRGIGTDLVRRLIRAARNRSWRQLVIICGAENRKMLHLGRKFGLEMTFSGNGVEGRLETSWPDYGSLLSEALDDSAAMLAQVQPRPRAAMISMRS